MRPQTRLVPVAAERKLSLTKPRTPRTNGIVKCFNGRIAYVLKTHRFTSGEDLEQPLLRYVALHNHQLPQQTLKSKTFHSAGYLLKGALKLLPGT